MGYSGLFSRPARFWKPIGAYECNSMPFVHERVLQLERALQNRSPSYVVQHRRISHEKILLYMDKVLGLVGPRSMPC